LYKRPDLKKSYQWLELAANAGNVIAQSHLAQLFYTKKGIFKDYEKAFNWAKAAANQGDRDAGLLLGLMYLEGRYVSKNFYKAVAFLKKASYKGCPIAMFVLGWLYRKGLGVKQDNALAYCWWILAYKFGNKQAMDVIINYSDRDMKRFNINKAWAFIKKIISKIELVPHWADTIF
jgi:TPR repeat protein